MLSNPHCKELRVQPVERPSQLTFNHEQQITEQSSKMILIQCVRKTTSVEKDGTGIKAMDSCRCRPATGYRANITQGVFVEQGRSGCPGTWDGFSQMTAQPTWH